MTQFQAIRRSSFTTILVFLIYCIPAASLAAQEYAPIDVSGFRDVIKHWNDKYGRDRQDKNYAPQQVIEIGDSILRFQVSDGGWPKSFNPLLNVPEPELRTLLGSSLNRSTLDNRTTYTQIAYLAKAYVATGEIRFRDGSQRGLDYIFAAQHLSGGWRGADVDAITFNDDVMVGVMRLLHDIDRKTEPFDWLDNPRRQQASSSLSKAIDATLKCQIVIEGVKTAWCQQHSHITFAPTKARSYELPSICPAESSGVVRFLMEIDQPTSEIIASIDAAVAWIDESKLTGIRVKQIEIDPVRFEHHTTTIDRIVVQDASAPGIWARYYDLKTRQPFFCNRDGTKVNSLAEVAHERRTGYGWYSTAPAGLVEQNHPAWKARIAAAP